MRKRFGQWEWGIEDPGMWEYYEPSYYDYDYPTEEWPSEARFVDIYEQQVLADKAVISGGGLLNIVKSILGIAAPVITSALTAEQAAATAAARQKALITQPITTSAAGILSGITSNLPLLAAIGLGAYFVFSRLKRTSPRRRKRR